MQISINVPEMRLALVEMKYADKFLTGDSGELSLGSRTNFPGHSPRFIADLSVNLNRWGQWKIRMLRKVLSVSLTGLC